MNLPRIVSERFPYVPIRIDAEGASTDLDALLDTGFDGDLIVPDRLAAGWPRPRGAVPIVLGDGSGRFVLFYRAAISFAGLGTYQATVLAVGGEVIIGRGLIARFGVFLDHGQRVIIEA